jgi:ABC-type phosphate transport system substrate-binding protein
MGRRIPLTGRMVFRSRWLALVIALCGGAVSGAAAYAHDAPPAGYQVIVNAANPVTSLPSSEVAKLFLKKTVSWPEGGAVQPVDLREDSDVRREFSKDVLGKDVSTVKGYWQERIFTGRAVPPIEKSSEAEAIAFVAANRDAIGYVAASTTLSADVKPLRVTH